MRTLFYNKCMEKQQIENKKEKTTNRKQTKPEFYKEMLDNELVHWMFEKDDITQIHPIVFNRKRTRIMYVDKQIIANYSSDMDERIMTSDMMTAYLYRLTLTERDDILIDEMVSGLNQSQMVAVDFLVDCAKTYHKITTKYSDNERKLKDKYREF